MSALEDDKMYETYLLQEPLMHDQPFRKALNEPETGLFSIKGDLDGHENAESFAELRQFIGLIIDSEEFLMQIELVNEIIMLNQLTFVPRAPQYVEGVINLRGKIIPAINLREMMGLNSINPSPQTRVIITHNEDQSPIGMIVDAISYVISLNTNQFEFKSLGGRGQGADLIHGISKRGDKVSGIIDVTKIYAKIAAANAKTDTQASSE